MRKVIFVLSVIVISVALPVDESRPETLFSSGAMPHNTAPEPVPEIAFNVVQDVRFLLFTRNNPTIAQQLGFRDLTSLGNSQFDANRPTRVLIHGFQSDATHDLNVLGTAAYLRHSDVNVIVGMK